MRHHERKKQVPILCTRIAAMMLAAAPYTSAGGDNAANNPDNSSSEKLERGRYLVTVAACNDCHTPWTMGPNGPEPDMSRMLSGHPESAVVPPPSLAQEPWSMSIYDTNTAWAGPWGVSFTANLTPDRETGLGKWTLRTFVDTIRSGRHLGRGREILPPMPWQMYKHFTDDDFDAIFTYLQSIPPVRNRVPDPLPPPAS